MRDVRESMAVAICASVTGYPPEICRSPARVALWLKHANAALAAIEAAGWQSVPRAADDETLDTIAAQFSEYADSLPSRTIARRAWAGALITAPKP